MYKVKNLDDCNYNIKTNLIPIIKDTFKKQLKPFKFFLSLIVSILNKMNETGFSEKSRLKSGSNSAYLKKNNHCQSFAPWGLGYALTLHVWEEKYMNLTIWP